MVHKVWPTLMREALFPTGWKRTRTSLVRDGRTRNDVGLLLLSCSGRRCSWIGSVSAAITGVKHIICQTLHVVPGSRVGCATGLVRRRVARLVVGRSVPSGRPGVVIDVVLPAEVVDSTLPAFRQRSKLINVRARVAVVTGCFGALTCLNPGGGGGLRGWVDVFWRPGGGVRV